MFGLIYVILRPVVRIYHFSGRVFSFEKLKAFQLYITAAAPEIRLVFERLSRRFEFETYIRLIFRAYAVICGIYEKRQLRRRIEMNAVIRIPFLRAAPDLRILIRISYAELLNIARDGFLFELSGL